MAIEETERHRSHFLSTSGNLARSQKKYRLPLVIVKSAELLKTMVLQEVAWERRSALRADCEHEGTVELMCVLPQRSIFRVLY